MCSCKEWWELIKWSYLIRFFFLRFMCKCYFENVILWYNIGFPRTGFKRVIFSIKCPSKQFCKNTGLDQLENHCILMSRCCVDMSWGLSLYLCFIQPTVDNKHWFSWIVIIHILSSHRMKCYRNNFPSLPLGACSAVSRLTAIEYLVEGGRHSIWEFSRNCFRNNK